MVEIRRRTALPRTGHGLVAVKLCCPDFMAFHCHRRYGKYATCKNVNRSASRVTRGSEAVAVTGTSGEYAYNFLCVLFSVGPVGSTGPLDVEQI